jgi:hypothetical protein
MNKVSISIALTVFLFPLSVAHAGSLAPMDRQIVIAQAAREHVDNNGRGESYWRQKADNLRQEYEDQQAKYDAVKREEQECNEQRITYRGSTRDCASRYRDKKIYHETKVELARKRLEVDLPEDARKAGAYPGWLR